MGIKDCFVPPGGTRNDRADKLMYIVIAGSPAMRGKLRDKTILNV